MLKLFFLSVLGNIDPGLSADRACEVSAMMEGSIPGTDRKTVIIVFITRIC